MLHFTSARSSLHHFLSHNKSKNGSNIFFDIVAFLIIIAAITLISLEHRAVTGDIALLHATPIDLNYHNLFEYSMRTVFRMFIAVIFAIIFAIIYGVVAAKNRRLEQILVPFLDILQSVPILGYISFTVTGFLALFPGQIMGAEAAAIFAIFTSQAWNITFSVYQSFKTIPSELEDAAKIFKMSSWQKFWRVEIPFAIPGIVWNMVVSMSGGWFFVVASEVITVGNNTITLPGIGSYIALALQNQNISAIINAVLAMTAVILLYDQFFLRPLVAWADKFRYEMTSSAASTPHSWVLSAFRRSIVMNKILAPIGSLLRGVIYIKLSFLYSSKDSDYKSTIIIAEEKSFCFVKHLIDYVWYGLLLVLALLAGDFLFKFMSNDIGLNEIKHVFTLSVITWLRVVILVFMASAIWVPIGVYVGLHPKAAAFMQPVAQFLAAFPVNILFPLAVVGILHFHLNVNIWISPLMIMGTQWYILFNVIAGAAALPVDLREASSNFRVNGWLWWKKVMLPAIAPYYVTGAITASGGAWNASIVAEVINFGDKKIVADGLGSYIAAKTVAGDFPKIALGIGMMALFVVVFNKIFWQPLYDWSKRKFQL